MLTLLLLVPIAAEHKALLLERFRVLDAPDAASRAAAIAAHGADVDLVLTNGATGFRADEIALLPKLKLLAAQGAGYENLDLAAARARGVLTCNGAGTNDDCVADHAFGLLIGIVRDFRKLDRLCREGVWRDAIPQPANVSGKKLGILGLGTIGQKIAKRAAAFDMDVGYHNRKPREGATQRYFGDLKALANWADFLILAAPGGPATKHLVNAEVLDALGPQGYIVNIGRGSVVDTEALAAALRENRIAGAGIDVYESEPKRPESLVGLDNVLLTPHLAGWSPEATQKSVDHFLANAEGHFAGRGVLTPI